MESVGDFLCGIFMTMYWIFRLIVTAISYLQIEFPFECINTNAEILLLFLTLICIICVFKRVTVGGIIYFIAYCAYFGPDLFTRMKAGVAPDAMGNVMVDFIAIILAAAVVLNIIISKTRKVSNKKGTDWFYQGKKYDRELDERADKNNYRIY